MHQSSYPKFLYVTRGKINDFFWNNGILTNKILSRGDTLYVPANSAHGILALEDDSEFIYLLGGKFDPAVDKNIYWRTPEFGMPELGNRIIISDKDRDALYAKQYDYLVLGASGWLGGHCVAHLRKANRTVLESRARLENPNDIADEIRRSQAKYVICAAGISGRPTIDWCDEHEDETYRINYLGILNLVEVCREAGVHLTIFGSGGVYTGTKAVYTENDTPDLFTKVYSKWRCHLEDRVRNAPNVMYLRIMYPCTFDGDPKCFRTKMLGRKGSVHNGSVSITPVPDLFPHIAQLVETGTVGLLNFTSEGAISLKVLADDTASREESEQARGIYELDTTRLSAYIPVIKTTDVFQIRCGSS